MQWEGVMPNQFILASIFSACASKAAMPEGKRMHAHMIIIGLESTVAVQNALVNMYCKGGNLEDALSVFARTADQNVVSWTTMIAAYAHHGHNKEALLLYLQMQHEGMIPNNVTYIMILDACAQQAAKIEGKQIHACIVGSRLELDVILATSLVNMYVKCGSFVEARNLFERLSIRNSVSWTAMIAGYAQHGHAEEALQFFDRMLLEGMLPDKVTIISIFDACTCVRTALSTGKQVHAAMSGDDFELDVVVATALVNMYGKCGLLQDARRIFDEMQERNVLSWTAMIKAYVHHGHSNEVFQLCDQMEREGVAPDKFALRSIINACVDQVALSEGKWAHSLIVSSGLESDVVLATALVNMYGKCSSAENAQRMFDKMPERNLVAWTAMIGAYAQHGHCKEALVMFDQMQHEGVTPNKVTFVSILSACASEASLAQGMRIHVCITNSELEADAILMTAIANMYGKCGSQEDARKMFDRMVERNVVSWNAMIAAYAYCGYDKEALQLFDQMQQQVVPNTTTFISILDVCASQTASDEGKEVHALVIARGFDHNVHVGNAVINMYGKCGRLDEAQKVFDHMPDPDVSSWNTVIAAYAQQGDVEKALNLFDLMRGSESPPDKVTFVSVLSACSHAGLLDQGRDFFVSLMEDYGITPTAEHYHCMIDMLGRAGSLNDAEDIINKLPFQPTVITWMTLLGACRDHPDAARGERAVKHIIELDSEIASPFVMLSNIYAGSDIGGGTY